MISKRILVLANSTKHHPMRCVAGRELIDKAGDRSGWGGWIRPVSSHDEGALNAGERRLADATDPKPLDIVELSLDSPENNALQPENWLIHKGEVWTKESTIDAQALLPLVEEPESLWLDPAQKADYSLIAQTPAFGRGLDRIIHGARKMRVAMMCAEKDPLDCHRCILVSPRLRERGLSVFHIHSDGSMESQDQAEGRLAKSFGLSERELFRSPGELVAEAYRRQGEKIAYREDALALREEPPEYGD